MSITSFLSLNGTEITEQGRTISDSVNVGSSEVELDAGITKRYIKTNKRTFSFKWEWLPTIREDTIDNREARNWLKNLALTTRAKVLMSVQLNPVDPPESIYVYVTDYSEDLVRRDVQRACDYYSVSLSVEEA
jgi:hypothetical protein